MQKPQRELDELWALNEPDAGWRSDEGYWVDKDVLINYYVTYFDTFRAVDLKAFVEKHLQVAETKDNLGAGTSMFHTNSTPAIEIAGDGKTAKGIWYSVGQVTQTPGGKQSPTYVWEWYGVGFIKVDGKWKIWHFMVMTDWSAGAGQSWAEDERMAQGGGFRGQSASGGQGGLSGQPGESSGKPAPTIQNTKGRPAAFAPPSETLKIPVPYQTFRETFSYGPPKN
jgi:hypothetical protein